MELDWSAQSPHIRTLFRPWQPGDGYDEATLQAAETELGVRLPYSLRRFYLASGRRRDFTHTYHLLSAPDLLVVRANTLIFCQENQIVVFWGIPCEALEEDDPPVVVSPSGPSGWDVESELDWTPSHAHLSGFLDDLLYFHALSGGAIHGAATDFDVPPLPEHHLAWLEENWQKATVGPLSWWADTPEDLMHSTWPPLYVRDGQAFGWRHFYNGLGFCWFAAGDTETLKEISQRFQITWRRRW